MLSVRNSFKSNNIDYSKVRRWEKIYYANINNEAARIAALILAKVDFSAKEINKSNI